MKQYYIVSVKHTAINDSALVLWAPRHRGFCWYRPSAGIYTDDDIRMQDDKNIFVPKEQADPLFATARYDGSNVEVLPNTAAVRSHLGISTQHMLPAKDRSCYMAFMSSAGMKVIIEINTKNIGTLMDSLLTVGQKLVFKMAACKFKQDDPLPDMHLNIYGEHNTSTITIVNDEQQTTSTPPELFSASEVIRLLKKYEPAVLNNPKIDAVEWLHNNKAKQTHE